METSSSGSSCVVQVRDRAKSPKGREHEIPTTIELIKSTSKEIQMRIELPKKSLVQCYICAFRVCMITGLICQPTLSSKLTGVGDLVSSLNTSAPDITCIVLTNCYWAVNRTSIGLLILGEINNSVNCTLLHVVCMSCLRSNNPVLKNT